MSVSSLIVPTEPQREATGGARLGIRLFVATRGTAPRRVHGSRQRGADKRKYLLSLRYLSTSLGHTNWIGVYVR